MVLARAVLAAIPTVQKEVKEVEANLIQKRDTAIIPIKNWKVAAASPIRMVKVTIAPKGVIVIATKNRKAMVANPTHMVKAAMATRAVMENLMVTKKGRPTEGMENMARVLSLIHI